MKLHLNTIKNLIYKTLKRPFVRNFTMVMTGAAFGQAVAILFSPILTRLYGPEIFGITGVVLSIVAITVPLSTLTYANALVLPKSDDDAVRLLRISIYFASFISIVLFILIHFFGSNFTSVFNISEVEPYLLFIPFFTFLNACHECFSFWLVRKGNFKGKTIIDAFTSVFDNSSKALLGSSFPFPSTMLFLSISSRFLGSVLLLFEVKKSWPTYVASSKLGISDSFYNYKRTALTYIDFPLLRTPQITLNVASQGLPIILLASFFGPASAGFFGIARRLVGIPVGLIGSALASVIYPRLAAAVHKEEKFDHLVLQATVVLGCIGIIPYALLFLTAPWLFQFVFGEEWLTAGIYAKWMSLWMFSGFLNIPSVQSIPIIGIQQWFLKFEIVSTILRVITIVFGFYFLNNDVHTIILYSVIGFIINTYLISYVYLKNRSFAKNFTNDSM